MRGAIGRKRSRALSEELGGTSPGRSRGHFSRRIGTRPKRLTSRYGKGRDRKGEAGSSSVKEEGESSRSSRATWAAIVETKEHETPSLLGGTGKSTEAVCRRLWVKEMKTGISLALKTRRVTPPQRRAEAMQKIRARRGRVLLCPDDIFKRGQPTGAVKARALVGL